MRCLAFLVVLLLYTSPVAAVSLTTGEHDEFQSGYITMVDETGTVVMETGRYVEPGDQYINQDNHLYEVTAVEGNIAKARFLRTENDIALTTAVLPAQTAAQAPKTIAVYHTHTDECYLPYNGITSIPGRGSIMLVGETFSKSLEQQGYRVIHNKTLHDPHDANAYHRSRRTFMKLLKEQPVALFDIHRDSAPLKMYSTTIMGQPTARLLLVVGKQNQNRQTSLNYAKRIKAAADAKYQGLVRGIFIARGNYNQDLNPRAMLVEVGTQYNSLGAAQRGIALFADIVPVFLRGTSSLAAAEGIPKQSGLDIEAAEASYSRDILYMVGAVVIGSLLYLYLSTGSWSKARNKLHHFFTHEFKDVFRSRRQRK